MISGLRKIVFAFLVIALYAPSIHALENVSDASEEDLTLEDAREILSKYHANRLNIDRSLEITKGIVDQDPGNVEALIFLSRVWLTYGYVRERTTEGKIQSFENGKEIAELAIKIDPSNPDAHFFYVANLALVGENKGIINSLFMLPEIRRTLDKILELDPNHCYGLGMQGALYYYLPGILGGDMKISEIYLRRALFSDPHLSSAKLYLAMNLRKQERYDEAMQVLEELINDKEPHFYPDWYLNRNYAVHLKSKIQNEIK